MSTRIQVRRGLAAQWVSAQNDIAPTPILASGEIGFETDTGKFKIGSAPPVVWGSLAYANPAVGIATGAQGGTGVNNSTRTITIGGNLLTSNTTTIGSTTNTVQLRTNGNTDVTLPTSGTLINSAFPSRLVAELTASTGAITANTLTKIISFTAPAGTLLIGDTFRFTGYATRVGANAGTTTFTLRINPLSLGANVHASVTTTATALGVYKFEALVTMRSASSAGGVGKIDATSTLGTNVFTAAAAVNNAVENVVEATINSGVAGNTYNFEYAILEKLNT
jgi:hypothetical protein